MVIKDQVTFTKGGRVGDYSYQNFKKYITNVFYYAGTYSLSKELKSKKIHNIQVGDVFIKGGFPGHGVIVVDVAKNERTGKKVFLLAQSFMPAQSIHILENWGDDELSPWYSESFGTSLMTPDWKFESDSLMEFRE